MQAIRQAKHRLVFARILRIEDILVDDDDLADPRARALELGVCRDAVRPAGGRGRAIRPRIRPARSREKQRERQQQDDYTVQTPDPTRRCKCAMLGIRVKYAAPAGAIYKSTIDCESSASDWKKAQTASTLR